MNSRTEAKMCKAVCISSSVLSANLTYTNDAQNEYKYPGLVSLILALSQIIENFIVSLANENTKNWKRLARLVKTANMIGECWKLKEMNFNFQDVNNDVSQDPAIKKRNVGWLQDITLQNLHSRFPCFFLPWTTMSRELWFLMIRSSRCTHETQ